MELRTGTGTGTGTGTAAEGVARPTVLIFDASPPLLSRVIGRWRDN
jgi:hypothetical protein